jgi:hypothetical protein
MQRLIERKQRRDMRNEIEARQVIPSIGARSSSSIPQSMRYDPTVRSSQSIVSGDKGAQMLPHEAPSALGVRTDTLKPAMSSAPSFYQP